MSEADRQTLKRNLDRLADDLRQHACAPGQAALVPHGTAGCLPTFDGVLCPICAPSGSWVLMR